MGCGQYQFGSAAERIEDYRSEATIGNIVSLVDSRGLSRLGRDIFLVNICLESRI